MAAKFVCDCKVVCANFQDFLENHTKKVASWGERVEVEEQILEQQANVEQMLKGEPYARVRRALRDQKRATGYVPKPQPRCVGPKPVCNKCVVDSDGKVVESKCFNKKCTFLHGKFDHRQSVRELAG